MSEDEDGFVDIGDGDSTDKETTMADMDNDTFEIAITEMVETADAQVKEIVANGETVDNYVRASAGRKFNEIDPMESASADLILKGNRSGLGGS